MKKEFKIKKGGGQMLTDERGGKSLANEKKEGKGD